MNLEFGTGGDVFKCDDNIYKELPYLVFTFKNASDHEMDSINVPKEVYAQRDNEDRCYLLI